MGKQNLKKKLMVALNKSKETGLTLNGFARNDWWSYLKIVDEFESKGKIINLGPEIPRTETKYILSKYYQGDKK